MKLPVSTVKYKLGVSAYRTKEEDIFFVITKKRNKPTINIDYSLWAFNRVGAIKYTLLQ